MAKRCSLALWFSTIDQVPKLEKTVFLHPEEATPLACRFELSTSATISRGIDALALLLLRSAQNKQTEVELVGGIGSAAASLDFLAKKNESVLAKVFGYNLGSKPRKLRVVQKVVSSDQAGRVCYTIDRHELSSDAILVFVDGKRLEFSADLKPQIELLESKWFVVPEVVQSKKTLGKVVVLKPRRLYQPENMGLSYDRLLSMFEREFKEMLTRTNIFSKLGRKRVYTDLVEESGCSSLRGIAENLSNGPSLGFYSDRELEGVKPIRIAVAPDLLGAVGILTYLKLANKFPVEIDYRFLHSTEIVEQAAKGGSEKRFDAFVTSAPPGSRLLREQKLIDYEPALPMPGLSRRVVAPRRKSDSSFGINSGCYLCHQDVESVSRKYLELLAQQTAINRHRVAIKNFLPHESAEALATGDDLLRAILVFPHYELNTILNNCELLDSPNENPTISQSILFLSRSLLGDSLGSELLEIAIRDAWLELSSSPLARTRVLTALLGDEDYLTVLDRCCGLAQLSIGSIREVVSAKLHDGLPPHWDSKRGLLYPGLDWPGTTDQKDLAASNFRLS